MSTTREEDTRKTKNCFTNLKPKTQLVASWPSEVPLQAQGLPWPSSQYLPVVATCPLPPFQPHLMAPLRSHHQTPEGVHPTITQHYFNLFSIALPQGLKYFNLFSPSPKAFSTAWTTAFLSGSSILDALEGRYFAEGTRPKALPAAGVFGCGGGNPPLDPGSIKSKTSLAGQNISQCLNNQGTPEKLRKNTVINNHVTNRGRHCISPAMFIQSRNGNKILSQSLKPARH